jgi:hypothetical protein
VIPFVSLSHGILIFKAESPYRQIVNILRQDKNTQKLKECCLTGAVGNTGIFIKVQWFYNKYLVTVLEIHVKLPNFEIPLGKSSLKFIYPLLSKF